MTLRRSRPPPRRRRRRRRRYEVDWIAFQRDASQRRVSWLAWCKKREEPAGKFAILIRERWRFSPAVTLRARTLTR